MQLGAVIDTCPQLGMEGREEDLNHICSGRCSVTNVPRGGNRGGALPCTQWGMLSDTCPEWGMMEERSSGMYAVGDAQ